MQFSMTIVKRLLLTGFSVWLMACGGDDGNGEQTYAVGDRGPAGGKVFYVTNGGLHGLEAAPEDLLAGGTVAWGCYDAMGIPVAGADDPAIGAGAQNTADILAGCIDRPIAASVADDYSLNGHSEWFLPSRDELMLMFTLRAEVGGFAERDYWSSTDYPGPDANLGAYFVGFQSGSNGSASGVLRNALLGVRAVREF